MPPWEAVGRREHEQCEENPLRKAERLKGTLSLDTTISIVAMVMVVYHLVSTQYLLQTPPEEQGGVEQRSSLPQQVRPADLFSPFGE